MIRRFWSRRVLAPVIRLLRQGITPEKIALCITLGVVIGVFPLIGTTTALCTLAAFTLRLNLPLIQLVNGLMSPLQLILIIPFVQVGERLFGVQHLPLTLNQVLTMIRAGAWTTVAGLWLATARAIAVWCCISWIVGILIYVLTVPAMRRLIREPKAVDLPRQP